MVNSCGKINILINYFNESDFECKTNFVAFPVKNTLLKNLYSMHAFILLTLTLRKPLSCVLSNRGDKHVLYGKAISQVIKC